MMGYWFDDFDDFSVIDLLDLPFEDVEENPGEEGLEPLPSDVFGFSADAQNILNGEFPLTEPLLSDAKPISGEGIVKSGDIADGEVVPVFQTTNPVFVPESSNAPTAESIAVPYLKVDSVKGPRSKRQRPDYLKKIWFKSNVVKEPEDHSIDHLLQIRNQTRPEQECTHCKTTSTPQWRPGPYGPRTLCNACGMRYRTGRLYQEYRPAASPTFVPSLHSNNHKKVIELRNKSKQYLKTHRDTSP